MKTMCAAGVLDDSWNGTGRLSVDFGGSDVASSLAVQADGKVIIGGHTNQNGALALIRTNERGEPDLSFGNQGRMTLSLAGRELGTSKIALQADGSIVVGGATCVSGTTNCSLMFARFTSSGQLDTDFGSAGIVLLDYGDTYETLFDMATQSDGKIVATGYYGGSHGSYDFITVRINSNGSLDDGSANDSTPGDQFGDGGAVSLDIGTTDVAWGLALQNDGKIVVAGRTGGLFASNAAFVVRMNSNGSLDSTFNGTGIVTPDYAGDEGANAVIILNDGSIVVGGNSTRSGTNQYMLMKISKSGQIISNFGDAGMSVLPIVTPIYGITSLVLQPDGELIGLGNQLAPDGRDESGLIRCTEFGALDKTFGNGGIAEQAWTGSNSQGAEVALTADGRILAAGYVVTAPGNVDMAISCYLSGISTYVRMSIKSRDDLIPAIRINDTGVTSITIYGSPTFDTRSINVSSLRFVGAQSIGLRYQDIDQDGILDAVVTYRTADLNLLAIYGDLLATSDTIDNHELDAGISTKQRASLFLYGKTNDGKEFRGSGVAEIFLSGLALRKYLEQLAGI